MLSTSPPMVWAGSNERSAHDNDDLVVGTKKIAPKLHIQMAAINGAARLLATGVVPS